MKRKTFILLALAIALVTFNTYAQDGTGSNRSVSGFNRVESGGPFNIHIKINGTESLRLDVDADLLDDIKTEVVGGTLKIGFKHNFSFHRNIKRGDIYITAKSLEGLGNSGSGSTEVEGVMDGQNVSVTLSGSGGIKTAVKTSSLQVKISGSGSINLKGNANDADFRISGSGEINGRELKTESAIAGISGSGNVYVSANKSVSARITGSGGVSYSGNAAITETKFTGSGRVNKVD
ncbi:head GIN domain-containing protein [Mucilaginibacter sp. SP1R1]|uniref:head GIN domain-containing protein n=1 Tax=Mucilaginibacter sp. SP1R1 TaxID=2723091 RepID=UPI00160C96A9|nr:head GIN domain-containing protein [Mucilaginibacter sp. SP1R1]MBB6149809.1 hypothetical protein [Mucilaginibacter sp. SP1R1]